jgi:hypothetical protein
MKAVLEMSEPLRWQVASDSTQVGIEPTKLRPCIIVVTVLLLLSTLSTRTSHSSCR